MIVLAVASTMTILRSLRRERLPLGFASVWLGLAVVVTMLGLGGDAVLDPLTRAVGVQYPPTLLFLVAILILLLLTAYLSLKVAALDRQIREVVDRYGRDHVLEPPQREAHPPTIANDL